MKSSCTSSAIPCCAWAALPARRRSRLVSVFLSLIVLFLFAFPPSRADAGSLDSTAAALREGHLALSHYDFDTAHAIASALSGPHGDLPDVRYFLGRLAFYEGRYADAVKAFDGVDFVDAQGKKDGFPDYARRVAAAVEGLETTESEHFAIRYDARGPDRILIPYAVPVLESAWKRLSSELGYVPDRAIRLEIFPTSDRFIQASGLTADEIQTTGTVALCIYDKLMITSPRALALGYRWMDTLSHELVHLFVSRRTGDRVPVWLQEGLARFFEGRWRGARGADMTPNAESLLAEALEADKLVPFERMSPSLAKLPSAEEAQLAFAQVQTVIEFILSRRGQEGIHRLLEDFAEGMNDREVIEDVLGLSFERFQDEWRAFLKNKHLKVLPGVAVLPTILRAQRVADGELDIENEKVADPFMERNKTLKDFTRLGDLLRERGRFKAALIEYGKARMAAPVESPALSVKIALTWLEGDNPGAARKALEETVARHPSFAPALTTLARAQIEEGDFAGAIHSLEEANAINPFNPAIHVSLAHLYDADGRHKRAALERRVVQTLTGSRWNDR